MANVDDPTINDGEAAFDDYEATIAPFDAAGM